MFLEKILTVKREEILREEKEIPLEVIKREIKKASPSRSLKNALKKPGTSIIAEIKKASPSRGVIREDFEPVEIAVSYEENGAAAISVLTEKEFFQGNNNYLASVRSSVGIPVMRKDFIINEYQIYQSKYIGADAVLLIAACLTRDDMKKFLEIAHSLNMECVVEVHDEDDVKKIEGLPCDITGINNRNLKTFEVTLETSYRLKKILPGDALLISESGIHSADDIKKLSEAGFCGVLMGEYFMKSSSPGEALKKILEDLK